MNMEKLIKDKLSVLKPQSLQITNDSHLHQGHSSSPNNGQSHFTLKIKADSISDKKLIEQHQIIKTLLKNEFNAGLHALSIKIMK